MANSENNLVTSYCVELVSAFRRLSHDLAIPQIDQELYTDLFVGVLEEQQCGEDGASAASSASTLNTSASDMQAEALVSLGGTELIVTALRAHEQQTLLVLQAVALRESVVARMWACCDAFAATTASASEEARFTFLRLLQEHQLTTLLTVESIFEWREMLSRPYPFLLRGGENYLLSIVADCAALDAHALVRSLANVRLRQDPLCAKVDLNRMLHRLEVIRRSRLITTGALWNVGLQPLQSLPARSRSRSADRQQAPSAGQRKINSAATKAAATPPTPPAGVGRGEVASRALSFDGCTPDDFVSEMGRLNGALKRHHNGHDGATSSQFSAANSTAFSSRRSLSAAARRGSVPHPPPPRSDSAETRQKQHRLLTAARVVEKEAALQRKVVEELYELAHKKERFVPLLDIPQVFTSTGTPMTAQGAAVKLLKNGYPADSWPLDRAQWPAVAAGEGRIDRLGCMSTAREALQTCDLLPAWQHRMGRRASEMSGLLVNQSKASATASSTPAEDPPTPLHSPHVHTTTTTAHSSTYSDSFELPGAASGSALAVDTRLPVSAATEHFSSSSSSSSSNSSSSFSTSSSGSEASPP